MPRVNIVKKVKVDGIWKLLSVPRNGKGHYDWNALPPGSYLIEWYAGGKRRRESAGVTAAQAIEVQRRKRHELEGRKLGLRGYEEAGETVKKTLLHVAVKKYLEQIEALKKPNTYRKYDAVLARFLDFFRDKNTMDAISSADLTSFLVWLKKDQGLGANTVLHNAVIIAQFLKRPRPRRHYPRTAIAGAHHLAAEGIPGGAADRILCCLLRLGMRLVFHLPPDGIS